MIKWVNKHRNLVITLIITLLLLIILSIITYLIYVYGYYDKIKENEILENFNSYKFNRVHDDLYLNDNEHLTVKNLQSMANLIFNKKNLEKIYEDYYQNTHKYSSKEEFVKKYYYGQRAISIEDISFENTGQTTILSRRLSKSKSYKITNVYDEETSIGIINNITFNTLGEDKIKLDEDTISCSNTCNLSKIYSGIHTIEFTHEGFTYFSILLIDKDNATIDIKKINNLVAISREAEESLLDGQSEINAELNIGIYSLSRCNLNDSCPSTTYSYITLNNDNSCSFYKYISLEQAAETYNGTYKRENGFLIIEFTSYTYSILDSETNKNKEIENKTNIKMTFKIDSKDQFSNNNYEFKFKA